MALPNPNRVAAAKRSSAIRFKRCEERRELRTLPCNEAINRLIHPTSTLASFRLGVLLVPSRTEDRPIPGFGRRRFDQAITMLRWVGCDWAHPDTRLRDLTLSERRQFAKAILEVAPSTWRNPAR